MAEAFRRRDSTNVVRRLVHAGVERRRAAVAQAETRLSFAVADLAEWEARIAALHERARGEAPPREALSDLREGRERALFTKSAREAELGTARKSLAKAVELAPTQAEVDAHENALRGLVERLRQAAELLADPANGDRVREVRAALGDPMGLQALEAELRHIEGKGREVLLAFERNTLGKGWWLDGVADEN